MTGRHKYGNRHNIIRLTILIWLAAMFIPCVHAAATGDTVETQVESLLKSGEEYLSKSDYNKALEAFITGLKLSETCDNSPYRMVFYKNIGNIYWAFGDY